MGRWVLEMNGAFGMVGADGTGRRTWLTGLGHWNLYWRDVQRLRNVEQKLMGSVVVWKRLYVILEPCLLIYLLLLGVFGSFDRSLSVTTHNKEYTYAWGLTLLGRQDHLRQPG